MPWTLVLPRDQFHFHSIEKPPHKKIDTRWPWHWLRHQNIRPEQWVWDVVEKKEPTCHWQLARTARAPMMAFLEPLKAKGIAPKHIRVAPEELQSEQLPFIPDTPVPQLKHAHILHTTIQQELGVL